MDLKTMISETSWESIEQYMKSNHFQHLNLFRKLYEELNWMEVDESFQVSLKIEKQTYMADDEEQVIHHVYGMKSDKKYRLLGKSFEKWLAVQVSEDVLKQYPTNEIISLCLWEMTTFSFENQASLEGKSA